MAGPVTCCVPALPTEPRSPAAAAEEHQYIRMPFQFFLAHNATARMVRGVKKAAGAPGKQPVPARAPFLGGW